METTIQDTQIFTGKVVSLHVLDVSLPDGRPARREVVRHPGGCAVVALNAQHEVALVRQFRTAIGRELLELPAGKLEKGEDPLLCAQRELLEETGLSGGEWRLLGRTLPSPGFCNEVIHLYLAEVDTQQEQQLDEDEQVEVLFLPFAEAMERCTSGAIQDGKTLCGLLLANAVISPSMQG